ncbi:hypothetical protein BH18ACT6_BH18ACT6_22690 [soil metagenome]
MKLFDAGLEAHGVIAVGQFATGILAFGQIATGVIAVGQLARGVIAIGQVGVGVVAFGQVALGLGYSAGMVSIGSVTGGLVSFPAVGRLPFVALLQRRNQFAAVPRNLPRTLLLLVLAAVVVWVALLPMVAGFDPAFGDAPIRR